MSQLEPESTPHGLGQGRRSLSRSSDEDLMVLVGRGDLQAFEHLVERYKVGVFSLCFQILRSREDAEEASQDTFIKAFRARDVYDPTRKVAPWLLRIASNAARDVLRKRETRIVVDTDLLVAEADALPDRRDDRSDAQRVDSEEVQRVLGELSEGYRMPLVLKYLNGLTNQEIAESLGMSLSSLKVRLARAREILHSRLWRRLKP